MNPRRRFQLKHLYFLFFALFAEAKPLSFEALFLTNPPPGANKTKKKNESKVNFRLPVPREYARFLEGQKLLLKPPALGELEEELRKLAESKLYSESKSLNRESDELFFGLEIKRAEKLAQKKAWTLALASFSRGLSGITSMKWVYYWDEKASKALVLICTHEQKIKLSKTLKTTEEKDPLVLDSAESCLFLAKKVFDAFPKGALEVVPLTSLLFPESLGSPENGERLSQSYTEKTEKDEQEFQDVLAMFLEGKHSDLVKIAKEFKEKYPKSLLRFRADFMVAESLFQRDEKKEAAVYYETLMTETPLSFYALVAAERMQIDLKSRVKKDSIQIDPDFFNLNPLEKNALNRIKVLMERELWDAAGIEFEELSRTRAYSNDLSLYLMALAHRSRQHLTAFRFASELIQRRYNGIFNQQFIDIVFPDSYELEIEASAKKNRIHPLWVQSMMKQESGFKANVFSSSGAIGLTQLMPFTALEVDPTLLFAHLKKPSVNIEIGSKYLASLFEKFSGNAVYSLAGYNAGPHRVVKWKKEAKPDWGMIQFIEAIPFKETREYVVSIIRNRYWYQYRHGVPTGSVVEGWNP